MPWPTLPQITPQEFEQINVRRAGQPIDSHGKYPADAVFEGGGVWGIAFLGAIRFCEKIGISWVGLAGTSAGAITASLLAADYTVENLEPVFEELDYMSFVKEPTYSWGLDRDPSDDLAGVREIVALLLSLRLRKELGRYKTTPFHNWLTEQLQTIGKTKFGDVFRVLGEIDIGDGKKRTLYRQLRVVTSDLTHGRLRVLPDAYLDPLARPLTTEQIPLPGDLAELPIAHAVRCSMSIPGFFEPARLPETDPSGAVIVDGGVLSNFPLWIFDDAPGQAPSWPTFGFRLSAGPDQPQTIDSITDLAGAMFRTMMTASDLYHLNGAGSRVINIDLSPVLKDYTDLTATAFNLSKEEKDLLYMAGYNSAKDFFCNTWNWKEHVKARTQSSTTAEAATAIGL